MSTSVQCPFNTTEKDGDVLLSGRAAKPFQVSGFDLNSLVHIVSVDVFLDLRIKAGSISTFNPKWISW